MLLTVKAVVVVWITLMSALGVWVPLAFVNRTRIDAFGAAFRRITKKHFFYDAQTTKLSLSLASCFSAGMLLTMALLHFFPEAFETGGDTRPPVKTLSFWLLCGVLIPAVLELCLDSGSGHSHGVSSDAEAAGAHGPGGASTSFLLIVLMSFHGITEGLLLGFEGKARSLLSAALPLSLHRFCDGLVIGVSLAKEVYQQKGSTEDNDRSTDDAPNDTSTLYQGSSTVQWTQRVFRGPVGVWLTLTPFTMVCVVVFSAVFSDPSSFSSSNRTLTSSTTSITSTTTTATPTSTRFASTPVVSIVQSIGGGSFIYIGLSILSSEEVKGVPASLALLFGVATTMLMFLLNGDHH